MRDKPTGISPLAAQHIIAAFIQRLARLRRDRMMGGTSS